MDPRKLFELYQTADRVAFLARQHYERDASLTTKALMDQAEIIRDLIRELGGR